MKTTKNKILFTSILIIFITSIFLYKNIPLRTAIYRKFAKQTVYIISEVDTIYSFGYFGVRKSLIQNNNKITLLAENNSFCNNCFIGYLIGRSGVIKGNYLYVAARSYLGGRYKSSEKTYLKGKLLILDKRDLSIIKEYDTDYSMIEAKVYKDNLVVSGLQGFNIYDISIPTEPKLTYSYRSNKALEFQGCEFIPTDTALYLAFARFTEGLSIYDITYPEKTRLFKHLAIQDTLKNGSVLPKGLQIFRLIVDYPHIYATLGPTTNNMGTKNDHRGIMIYDISDIKNIKQQVELIPPNNWYKTKTGDPQPSHISLYKNKIYVNFCEKGVAVFNRNDSTLKYEKLINAANGKMILPLDINHDGILLLGDFNSEKIFSYNLNN